MNELANPDLKAKIKKMGLRDLELLTYEIRDFLISNVSETGGHLASNLGVVELTLALHRVFDVSRDKIVWDVGHQTYVHKILTGRAGAFKTLRQYGGISGFPKTGEDPCDVYNGGHGSVSISAAMGLAEARDIKGEKHHVLAVIGDGALTGGLAYEGLNNAGNRQSNMIVVLNDNEMSISENTGSVAQYLSKLRASQKYQSAKHTIKDRMARIPRVGQSMVQGAERMKNLMRYAVVPGTLFEELGFSYYGPVDGHNLGELIELFKEVKRLDGPVLLHVVTKKGKGYVNAEKHPDRFHGIVPFDPETGAPLRGSGKTWSAVAGETMMELSESDDRVVCISAAMTEAVGLSDFAKSYFKHFYDVGIAEEHAVIFAAGLALGGLRPFVFIYSTFLQRAYDQIAIDICAQKLPVVFMIDRAGNVGGDGETHHGVFDLSYLCHIPGLVVMAPKDAEELRRMARHALTMDGPACIRYPRGEAAALAGLAPGGGAAPIEIGVSERLREGGDIELRALGKMVGVALDAAGLLAAGGIEAAVVNERFAAPLDEGSLIECARRHMPIITLEDNVRKGGFGESVCALLAESGQCTPVLNIAWPDEYVPQGGVRELMAHYGMDAASVAGRVQAFLRDKNRAAIL
ncbi:MAG: 1-deoxy-D-xylulose-5-phosphate synthase [Clostridiales Family XIII bacterium]|jgi:1-deoxy-D-xylulose-5-phosphate synthase|nr:1-deoxy-D-xylulose-5-phosphate synthase [Clostridiales Family XIII bacterium]